MQNPPPDRDDARPLPDARRDALLDDALLDDDPVRGRAAAVIDGELTLSRARLRDAVARAAGGLRRLGVRAGDVVAWQLPSWHEAVVVHLAALRLGAVSNPIVPIYRRRELEYIVRTARPRVLVVPATFRGFDHAALADDLRATSDGLEHVVVVRGDARSASSWESLLAAEPADPEPGRAATDTAVLLFTSGTTAAPKGVLHPHATLEYDARSLIALYGLRDGDPTFMPSPLSHVTGVLCGIHLPLILGGPVVLQDVWDPGVALRLLAEHRCVFSVGATPFVVGLTAHPDVASHDLSALRVFACGGADVAPQVVLDAERALGCVVPRVYGSSEMPTVTSGSPGDPADRRASTDGRPIGSAEVRIVADGGGDAAPGDVGEIVVRGPELFDGYLAGGEPQASPFHAGGWFATGDLGSLDADGRLTVRGRAKDIIVRGGENISVREVEELLAGHPAVADVAIVAMPDPVMVERACAFVVPEDGAEPTLPQLCDWLRGHDLASQKLPERLEIVDALPRTPAGKVQRFELRARVRRRLHDEQSSIPSAP